MAVMTYSNALAGFPEVTPVKSAVAERPSLFARLLNAMMESRYRAAEREIARYRSLIAEPVAAVKVDKNDLPFNQA